MSMVALFANYDDPTKIGPGVAFGTLSLFYGTMTYMVCFVLHSARQGKGFAFQEKSVFPLFGVGLLYMVSLIVYLLESG